MSEVSKDTAAQLRFEFYKSVQTLSLATLGGEITLLNSVFKDSPRRIVALASIIVLTCGCLFILRAKESMISRLDPLPRTGFSDIASEALKAKYIRRESLLSRAAGVSYTLALTLFVYFVWYTG
jgi:hypothetical protein